MARQGVTEARSLLRTVLVNRLVFTPVPRPAHLPPPKGPGRKPRFVYELRGQGSLSKLFTDVISASSVVAPYLKALRSSTAGPGHGSPLLFLAVAADSPVMRLSASTRFVGAISSPSWAA